MKVLVIGANGKVARHFAKLIENDGSIDEVAMVRKPEQVTYFKNRKIETILLDLVKSSVDELAAAMHNVDAVVFSAGAGGKGYDKTIQVDLDGAIKAMLAAEQAEIDRFVMVSTFRTGRKEIDKDNDLKVYTIAKHYADEWLKHRTNLDWTIIHPGILSDSMGTNRIKVGMGHDINQVPRQDVARAILATLRNGNTIGKEFEVLAGDTPVEEAIQSV